MHFHVFISYGGFAVRGASKILALENWLDPQTPLTNFYTLVDLMTKMRLATVNEGI